MINKKGQVFALLAGLGTAGILALALLAAVIFGGSGFLTYILATSALQLIGILTMVIFVIGMARGIIPLNKTSLIILAGGAVLAIVGPAISDLSFGILVGAN